MNPLRWPIRLAKLAVFGAFFLRELIVANARVAWEILTPPHKMTAGIVAVPLHTRNDWEATLMANLVTLTPGTLTIDIEDDRSKLYVHSMYVASPDAFRKQMSDFERRLLKALR